jgi:hypothetical protein
LQEREAVIPKKSGWKGGEIFKGIKDGGRNPGNLFKCRKPEVGMESEEMNPAIECGYGDEKGSAQMRNGGGSE